MSGEVIGLIHNHVQRRKQEVDGHFVYQKRQLPTIAGQFKAVICVSSIEDAFAATRGALGGKKLDPSLDVVIVWGSPLPATKRVTDTSGTCHWVRHPGGTVLSIID